MDIVLDAGIIGVHLFDPLFSNLKHRKCRLLLRRRLRESLDRREFRPVITPHVRSYCSFCFLGIEC